MTNLARTLREDIQELPCATCHRPVQSIDLFRSAMDPGYQVNFRCHGERKSIFLSQTDIRRKSSVDVLGMIREQVLLLTAPSDVRPDPPVTLATLDLGSLRDRVHPPPPDLGGEAYRFREDADGFLLDTPIGTVRITTAMMIQSGNSTRGIHEMLTREIRRQLGRPPAEIWGEGFSFSAPTRPPERPPMTSDDRETARRFTASVSESPRPEQETTTIREQTVSLEDIGRAIERCRNLISGLPLRTIFMLDADHGEVTQLVTRVLFRYAGGITPGGFSLDRSPEFGTVIKWRDIPVQACSRKPALGDAATLDISGMPLIYVNQSNHPMEFWPPWIERPTATAQSTFRLAPAPHAPPAEISRGPDLADYYARAPQPDPTRAAAEMAVAAAASRWQENRSTVTVGWGDMIESPNIPRRQGRRRPQSSLPPEPPPRIEVAKPATGRKIIIRKPD